MLGRKHEASGLGVVFQISSSDHPAQPFARIAFLDTSAVGKLGRSGWPVRGKVFEKPKPVTKDRQKRSHGAACVIEYFLDKSSLFRLVDQNWLNWDSHGDLQGRINWVQAGKVATNRHRPGANMMILIVSTVN